MAGTYEQIQMEDNSLLEDMNLESGLDDFYSNPASIGMGTVNLQPSPMAFGNTFEEPSVGKAEAAGGSSSSVGAQAMAAAASAVVGAAATAVMQGKLGQAGSVLGESFGGMAGAAVPAPLQPMKDKAAGLMSKSQPWKSFFMPMSIPKPAEGCSRITANLYMFQTNYAILFILYLILNIILQPSALISIVMIGAIWAMFLKKNDDPDWKPVVSGMELGPVQRWLALATITVLVLLIMAGSTIINSAFMFVVFVLLHGVVHDPAGMGIASATDETPVPL